MLAPERREKILEEVTRSKSALVKDLCVLFGVTGETIRKDLSVLEKEGKLLKTHGGAYVNEGATNEIHASLRQTLLPQEKQAIARLCAARVQSGHTVMLDESTTCTYIAKALAGRSGLTIITNSLQIADTLAESEGIQLMLCGGRLSHKNLSFVGGDTVGMLRHYHADHAFVSCRGLDKKAGITDGSPDGGLIRQIMLQQADKCTLVVDRTKLGLAKLYKIGGFELIGTVMSDTFSKDWKKFFSQKGIEFVEALPQK